MDERPVIWDPANRKHIEEDHAERAITVEDVEQAMTDPERDEAPYPKREGVWFVRGLTASGHRLYVAWVDHPGGRYPIHAHAIGRRGR